MCKVDDNCNLSRTIATNYLQLCGPRHAKMCHRAYADSTEGMNGEHRPA